jgi:hypothetical protein
VTVCCIQEGLYIRPDVKIKTFDLLVRIKLLRAAEIGSSLELICHFKIWCNSGEDKKVEDATMTMGFDTIKLNTAMISGEAGINEAKAGTKSAESRETGLTLKDRFEQCAENLSYACTSFARRHPFGSTFAARTIRDTAMISAGSAILLGVPTAIIAGPASAISVIKTATCLGGLIGAVDGISNGLTNDFHITNGYDKFLTWPCRR